MVQLTEDQKDLLALIGDAGHKIGLRGDGLGMLMANVCRDGNFDSGEFGRACMRTVRERIEAGEE
jgi:hypothetical protein